MERTSWAKTATIGMMAAAFLLVLAVPALAPGAQAAPVQTAGNFGSGSQWAYGAMTWANTSVTLPNGTVDIHAYFGWHVIFTATNISANVTMLEVERTAGAGLFANLCSPNCAQPTTQANLTIQAWERTVGFANITSAASVVENQSTVAAWGILNESGHANGNLTERLNYLNSASGSTRSSSAYLSVATQGAAQISFGTPLGVLPLNMSAGEAWTSTAPYSAVGSWSAVATFAHAGLLGQSTVVRSSPNGSVTSSGDLTLFGRDLGTVTLNNGVTTDVIVLAVPGPFALHEGLILIPSGADLFATTSHPWDSDGLGITSFATDRVDIRLLHGAFFRLDAATSSYSGTASSVAPESAVGGVTPAASGSEPSGELQAQPETPAQAQQASACLAGQCGTSGTAGLSSAFGFALIAGLAVALVVGSVGVIEYRRWAARGRRSQSLTGAYLGETMQPVAPGATLVTPTRPALEPQQSPSDPRTESGFPEGPQSPR